MQAGVSAVLCKGLVLSASAVSIPVATRYLGAEQFGVWVTISTTLTLLIMLDLGISNTITNRLSEAYARNDKQLAGSYATTGLFIMVLIAIAMGLAGAAFWPFIDWGGIFRLTGHPERKLVSHAVAAAYIVFLFGLPAGLAAKFLGGYQEVKTANIVAAIGAVANLAAVIGVALLHGGLTAFVAASSGAIVGTNLGCLVWLWLWHKPWLKPAIHHWKPALVRPLLRSGTDFFLLQIAGLIVFNSDNLVIAHYLGVQQVTPYSVTWRLVGYAAALQIILTPALWPAYAEAWVRHDLRWIRATLGKVMASTMTVAAIVSMVLILYGRFIIRIWAGPSAVPSQMLLVLMCAWILISTFMANTATVLAATDNARLQARLSLIAAGINLAASIWLVQRIGPAGVLLGTIGSYLLVLIVPQTWKAMQVLRIIESPQDGHV